MRLSTHHHRSLLLSPLLGLMGLLATAACMAADPLEPAKIAIEICPVAGGVDATLSTTAEREATPSAPAQSTARALDWRAMLPAVTLRSRY